ncbi:hypothetical protein [Pelagibacterium limicola]|uniref:hypothetical protein n=1 Tax=Pelagibacterium limicola TaxID=2791022 RepID=UPI0018AFEC6E|nr:hypothetical protein [Pelagibacterium limicola]
MTSKPELGEGQTEHERDGRAAKEQSADFLVTEFGVAVPNAADLVADDEKEAEEITEAEFEKERERDPLEDVPSPESPDPDYAKQPGHHMQKEVLHRETEDPS